MQDAPLDMRMGPHRRPDGLRGVNTWPEAELKRILYTYGEERYALALPPPSQPGGRSGPLPPPWSWRDLIRSAMPAQALREKQHPAKRSFQAIRIAVNDEFGRGGADAGGPPSTA